MNTTINIEDWDNLSKKNNQKLLKLYLQELKK